MFKLYDLLLEIRDLLENKKIEIDSNLGQVAGTIQGDQIQNNYYRYKSFIPLQNFNQEIEARIIKYTKREKIVNTLNIVIPMIILAIWIDNIVGSLFFLSCFSAFFYFFILFQIKKDKASLKINNNELILTNIKKSENTELKFEEIRSFAMEWDFLGYQFFLYKEGEINPKMQFSVRTIHQKIAIEELLSYKLNNIQNKEKED